MMPSRGYRNYRGRTSKAKILLAIVLIFIILAASLVIALERYMVYDENGRLYFRLPAELREDEENPPPDQTPEEDVGLIIEGPETLPEPEKTPPPIRAFSYPEKELTVRGWNETYPAALGFDSSRPPADAVVITMKDRDGYVYFDTAAEVRNIGRKNAGDTEEAIRLVTSSGLRAVAKIAALRDFRVANANEESMGLKNTGDFIFYDLRGANWLDPAKPESQGYIETLSRELAELGFDEILLTEFSYPTEGKLDKIDYSGFSGEEDYAQNLTRFLSAVRSVLEPYQVALSLELSETAVLEGGDETAGQRLGDLAPLVDRIYVPTDGENLESLKEAVASASAATQLVPEFETLPAGYGDEESYLLLED